MKKPWLVMTAIVIITVISAISIIAVLLYPKVYSGVTLEGMDISGYSREEVTQVLTLWQPQYKQNKLEVEVGNEVAIVAAGMIEYDLDTTATLNEVFSFGRNGSWWEKLKNIYLARRDGYSINVCVKYNEAKLNSLIENWQAKIIYPPRNATFSMVTKRIINEETGSELDVSITRQIILDRLKKQEDEILILPIINVPPEITKDDIARNGICEIMSSYTTTFNNNDTNRTENIALATKKINGQMVENGKTFSFNGVVGPRQKIEGFKESLEIVDGEFAMGIGGGVCQLSSTLYNAILLANLPIIERCNHSKPLSYIPMGRDATVAFDIIDFKFCNNTLAPILIVAEIEGDKLLVGLWGQKTILEQVEISTSAKEEIQPKIIKIQDDSLDVGEFKVEQEGKVGYIITTIRIVKLQGREIKREVLSTDTYLPDDTIVKIGTKVPQVI